VSGPAEQEPSWGEPASIEIDDGVSPLVWSVNPWRRSPAQATAAVLLTLAIAVFILRFGLPTTVAAVLAVAVALSLAPAWLVIHCRIDDQGVGRELGGIWTRRRWTEIRRVRLEAGARAPELFVSPQERPGPLDAFRGLHLPLPREGAERTRVATGIHHRVSSHGLRR
jgi:hypothetical protein